ncbi:MAG: hypothetical protein K1X88_18945 [Nannocystaceae bacterium]|nr:hypothetical protein [Nannocystaceae bacterium]
MPGAGEAARGWALVAALLPCACEELPRTYNSRGQGGTEIFRDDFERDALGERWHATAEGAWIEHGVLKLRDLRNHPLWLDLALPDDVRIEFDAWAASEEGDVKVELCGDGVSVARSVNYVASGYVVVFGGWNNSLHAIARKNEHGRDRVTASAPTVEAEQRYHFALTRSGSEIIWEVDGRPLLEFEDPAPLRGPGHDRFAFSGWEAESHFDNLVIEAL